MPDFGECEERLSFRKIVRKEKSRRFVILNPKCVPVRVVHIDGCVIRDPAKLRCDYLFIPTRSPAEIYVEFKGDDVGHAIKQIEATIPEVSEDIHRLGKHCFIVCGRVAPYLGTQIQKARSRFQRRFNARLKLKKDVIEHTLS